MGDCSNCERKFTHKQWTKLEKKIYECGHDSPFRSLVPQVPSLELYVGTQLYAAQARLIYIQISWAASQPQLYHSTLPFILLWNMLRAAGPF